MCERLANKPTPVGISYVHHTIGRSGGIQFLVVTCYIYASAVIFGPRVNGGAPTTAIKGFFLLFQTFRTVTILYTAYTQFKTSSDRVAIIRTLPG